MTIIDFFLLCLGILVLVLAIPYFGRLIGKKISHLSRYDY